MSTSGDVHLDLQVIAELLGAEDLNPPSSKPTNQNHSILGDDKSQPAKKAKEEPTQNVLKPQEAAFASPKCMEQDEELTIPGLESSSVSRSAVPTPISQLLLPAEIETDTLVMPTKVVTSSSSGSLSEAALNTILTKHNLQMITSDSSGEDKGEDEEGDTSSSETDSDETDSSDSSDSSDSDSDSTSSSRASSNLPMKGSGGSDTEVSRLRTQHKKNKAKLDRMVHEEDGSEDGLEVATGMQASSMFATTHEIVAPQVTMPSITEIPDDEPIELLGEVTSIVDSVVVVKSLSNGIQRVLDTDSMLVLENRKVLGLVFETFGPLTAPLYSIRFPSSAHFPSVISAFAESPSERPKAYYCPSRSTFAYTSQLLLNRGNDASNPYDEEVSEDELEFSDDEAERAWKRKHNKSGASGKRKRGSRSRAGSPRSEESSALPYDDEVDVPMSAEGDTCLPYVDPYDDEPTSPTQTLPSTSNGPFIRRSLVDSPVQLPPRPSKSGRSHEARGRGRGQSNFSGERGRGRGKGRGLQSQVRGRQLPRDQVPTAAMGPPGMIGNYHHAEYNPSFAGNFLHNAGNAPQFMPMANGGITYQNSGSFPGAPYNGGMEFPTPFMGMQPTQAFHGPVNGGGYGGVQMHTMGAGAGMPPFMNGPAPGAYVNPRFAMMQLPTSGGRESSLPRPYGEDFQVPRQNP